MEPALGFIASHFPQESTLYVFQGCPDSYAFVCIGWLYILALLAGAEGFAIGLA